MAGGLGAAWAITGGGLSGGAIVNGPWTTSLGFGTKATDAVTRAAVARAGLLALPAKETVYWSAKTDATGASLDGNCRYSLSGTPLDARWWSVTIYDEAGYLVANRANIWSVNGANVALDDKGQMARRHRADKACCRRLVARNQGATLSPDPAHV